MKPIRLYILLILLFASSALSASGKYDILLKSGKVTYEPNLDNFLNNPNIQESEIYQGNYFRLVQFNNIPSESMMLQLEQKGIFLLSYLPNYSYLTAIKTGTDLNVLKNYDVRLVIPFQPDWKLGKQLKQSSLPSWAMQGENKIDVVVRYYKNLDGNAISSELTRQGHSVLRRYDYGKWIEVRIDVSKIQAVANLPFVAGLDAIAPPSTPDDEKARSLHRSSTINTYSPMGRHYDGTGVSAALADDGPVGPHIDYTGRIDQSNTTSNNGNHGDMTTGILMGSGNLDPTIRGMGTGAFIYIYDIGGYNHILNSPVTNQTLGVLVTSTSYSQGCNEYTTDTQTGDQILNENPTLLHVYSAGNNGPGNCGYGAGGGWGNITGGYKQGKNVISCGNLNYVDALEGSSSRGPAEDGRIKPDICANGIDQLSTDGPNDYQVGGGTSAACPGIAGIVTQLHHAYRDLNSGQTADGALIKACMLNTADDLGNPGPDFKHGWGRVNAFRAVTTLEDNRFLADSVSQGVTNTHNITVPANTQQLRVMIYWCDVEGDPLAAKALVNDINMTVTDPAATLFNPWVLDETPVAANLNAPAIRDIDDLNNMEQVTIDNPATGTYTVEVDGFLIPQGPQKYFMVYEFVSDQVNVTYPIGYEGFVPGEVETIRWDAFGNSGSFLIEYSIDNGGTWTTIVPTVAAAQRYYNWTVPSVITGQALIRVTRNAVSGTSPENFSIIGLVQNIQVDWACPDSIRLTWNALPGAIGYEISALGSMYMDSIAYSTTNSVILTGTNPLLEYWFSVLPITPDNTKGRRAYAINKQPGVFSCPIAIDASLNQLISPASSMQNCQDLTAIKVKVTIENKGMSQISNIPVFYSVDGGPVVSETVSSVLASFATIDYEFTATYDFSAIGSYDLLVWTDYTSDGNNYNDTIQSVINVASGTLITLPYAEDFESFNLCATTTNCEQENCTLNNGWMNQPNQNADDIDWRTSQGSTPSADTGPDADHNPGTVSGNYLYLEASACFNQRAEIISPCIDLTPTTAPQVQFWYHMYGAAMGTLHVDVFANDAWQNDVMPAITGNQGNLWQQATINLAPFAGGIINLRFRGETGGNFTSDMAIDDINIFEVNTPPIVSFIANPTNPCMGQTVNLTDLSLNSPNAWVWTITPSAGVTFVNATTANSQNPEVQFSNPGSYDVELTATNAFGSNTVNQVAYITAGSGSSVPLIETFTSPTFPPANWQVENPDANVTWVQSSPITGSAGTITVAAFMDNYSYNALGEEDGLVTERVSLSGTIAPAMTFDVAYARYSAAFADGLRIDISTDCGLTYSPTSYSKYGTDLATTGDQTGFWQPTSASEWRNDTLFLTGLIGNDIILKFVNINGYGNSLFIDNINFTEIPLGVGELAGTTFGASVYPNPGKGLFTVNINSIQNADAAISVMDLKGSLVKQLETTVFQGINNYELNLKDYEKGIYLVRIQSGENSRIIKLVVI
jgi:PKD repeat protein